MRRQRLLVCVSAIALLVGCQIASPTPTGAASPLPTEAAAATSITPAPTVEVYSQTSVFYADRGIAIYGYLTTKTTTDSGGETTEGYQAVCVLKEGQPPVYLAQSAEAWSVRASDDHALVAVVELYDKLWVVDTDKGEGRLLFSADNITGWAAAPSLYYSTRGLTPEDVSKDELIFFVSNLEWLPGTHQLVFTTAVGYPGMDISYPNNDLFIVDADTGAIRTPLSAGSGGGVYEVSPDGRHIAVVDGNSISLIDSDGGNWRRDVLVFQEIPHPAASHGARAYANPVWSPDSSGLWVAIPPSRSSATDTLMTTWHLPADGSPPAQVAAFEFAQEGVIDATFSPGGQVVAYTHNGDLHIMQADGSQDTIYASQVINAFADHSMPAGTTGWQDATHFLFWKSTGNRGERGLFRGEVGGPYELLPEPTWPAGPVIPDQGCKPGQ